MNRNYVIINGVNSLTIKGLAINLMPPITKPLMRTMREEIDGRNGDINTELGYQAYDKQIEVGLYGNYDIDEIIAFFNSKGTIVFSDENDKFYNYQILDKIDFAKMVKFRTAMINIHCQPFKYPLTDTSVDVAYEYVESTGENLTLDNTEASSLKMDLKGNTYQTTISGKNLFDIATNTSDNYATNTNISSISGNTMILNGGAGASSRVIRLQNQVANKTYTASFNTDITTNRILVRIRKSDDSGWITNSDITWSGWTYNTTYAAWYYSANASNNKATFTFTVPSGLYWQFGIVNVNSTSATFSNIQLEEGSSATTYEPYVGGVPSPNPQFPQPVNVVSGDNEIDICGKNRLKMPTTTQTYNSRTYAISSGSLKITGNSSAENTINLFTGQRQGAYGTGETITIDNSILLKAGTYTLSFNATARVSWHYIIGQIGSVFDNSNQFNNIEGNYTKTFTITQDSYFTLSFYDYSTSGQVREFTNMQLELGNATTYEPYIGNTYPIYLGVENLLSLGTQLNGYRNLSTGVFTENATSIGYYFSTSELPCQITFDCTNGNRSNVSYYNTTPANGVTAQSYNNSNSIPRTITIDKTYPYVHIQFSHDQSVSNIEITQGNHIQHISTTPIELCKIDTYVDGFGQSTGKNLFDASVIQGGTKQGVTLSLDGQNIHIEATSPTGNANFYMATGSSISLDAGTYYLTRSSLSGVGTLKLNSGATTIVSTGNSNVSFILNETTIIDGLTLQVPSSVGAVNIDVHIQIEKGTQATEWQPFGVGKWYLHKEIGKVVFNGTETGWYKTNDTSASVFVIANQFNNRDTTKSASTISNYFKYQFVNSAGKFYFGSTNNLALCMETTYTLETFKTWLGTHNTMLYYVLATPINTEITNETLISQLNAIKQAMSYSGQTNITQDNSDKPFMIDATALKKGSDTASLNNIGNIYSKPVIALKGTGIVNIYKDGVQSFQVDMSEENDITIDTEMMEAYTPTKLANRQVAGDYSKFMIDTGSHNVKFDGELTEATITRYVRWL